MVWCPMNETWQRLTDKITQLDDVTRGMFLATKVADPTRPVLDSSGYSHRVPEADVYDSHDYEQDPAKFAVCVETNVQSFWHKQLASAGQTYRPAHLVLFTEATPSGCGTASAETGPFYCPPDGRVYLDLGFFQELQRRFHARGGDFAEAYVIAHEYGHRVQDLVGIERQVRRAQAEHPDERNALSVRMELQADCYAGVWGHAAFAAGKVSHDEIAEALDAAASIGDDRIQKQALGRVNPETFTHGSSADRQKWFTAGMQTGDPAACDTFRD